MELTKSELEIMNVIWKENRPLTRGEILKYSSDKTWKDSSVHILLNGLMKKKAIVAAGFAKSGKTYGRVYAANISGEDYYSSKVFSYCGQAGLPNIFSALIRYEEVTPELIDQLEEMLEKRRKELTK